jgi:hypothetical protein
VLENLGLVVIFTVTPIGIAYCIAAMMWIHARRCEREALYRSEAIKKVAEMQGTAPEPVLQLLREALGPPAQRFPTYPAAAAEYRREREAFYRAEMFKKLGELHGSGAVLDYLREEEELAAQRRGQGMMLGGLITMAVGAGVFVALMVTVKAGPAFVVGVAPFIVGLVLVAYALATGRRRNPRSIG